MAKSRDRISRRRFLRAAAAGAAGALSAPLFTSLSADEKKRPLNVIVIFTDDQGAMDLNCYGSKDLRTPNLDALAASGVRFTQFYVGAPVCSPSRAAMLTGRCPQRAGVPGNVGPTGGLPTEQVTLADMLRKASYRTAIFGKWHLGHDEDHDPLAQGFDEFVGHKNGCIDNYSHFFYWSGPNRHDLWRDRTEVWEDGTYFPDIIVREARRFLKANKDRPFFIYLPFNNPHYPMQGLEKYCRMYADLPEPRRAYAAFVSTLDEKIGEVLKELDALGLRDRTLILYASDNGHSVEERANFGGGNAGPYRGHKFDLWEGGIRLPSIVSLPGVIPAGQVRGQVVTSLDWLPTIADLCGLAPPDWKIDGRCITAVLKSPDAPSPHEVLHWESGGQWAVRMGPWKLVANKKLLQGGGKDAKPAKTPAAKKNARKDPEEEPSRDKLAEEALFLSNLDEDVTETRNLAGRNPEIVARMVRLHEEWVAEVGKT